MCAHRCRSPSWMPRLHVWGKVGCFYESARTLSVFTTLGLFFRGMEVSSMCDELDHGVGEKRTATSCLFLTSRPDGRVFLHMASTSSCNGPNHGQIISQREHPKLCAHGQQAACPRETTHGFRCFKCLPGTMIRCSFLSFSCFFGPRSPPDTYDTIF